VPKSGPIRNEKNLLKIWKHKDPDEELSFGTITKIAKEEMGLKKRTVVNYLNILVDKENLEKRVDAKRKTYYRPKNKLELEKVILKDQIDKIEDHQILAFSLFFLTEAFKQKSESRDYFKIVQVAAEKLKVLTEAQEKIKQSVEQVKKT